jgi:large conductance mechanosensitive channel
MREADSMKIRQSIGGFKSFIMKGNVLDLAVGVIIGAAFGKIVSSLVNDVLMPVIGLVMGNINVSSLQVLLKSGNGKDIADLVLKYGSFIQSIIDFLIIALCVYLFIKLIERFRRKKEEAAPPAPTHTHTEELLEEIRDLLKDKK